MGNVLWLAIGLAMDATAAAASRGLLAERVRLRDTLKLSLLFGGAQALMPYLGYRVGVRVGPLFEAWAHWVAFGILLVIGGHMLVEAGKEMWQARRAREVVRLPVAREAERLAREKREAFRLRVLVLLALATSIDALAAGIALPMLGVPIVQAIAVIGGVTALMSAVGLYAGRKLGDAFGPRIDAFGGVLLIWLGTKILLEHLNAG